MYTTELYDDTSINNLYRKIEELQITEHALRRQVTNLTMNLNNQQPATAIQKPKIKVSIDPIDYLNSIKDFTGNANDLYTFVTMIDRIQSRLNTYDDESQGIFFEIIKSKARKAVEIQQNVKHWKQLRNIFLTNFGETKTSYQLYNELIGLKPKTTCLAFYNEIINVLRRLNNKIRVEISIGVEEEVEHNCRIALKVFKNKLPQPMKEILYVRNPNDLQSALRTLTKAGYAHANIKNKYINDSRQKKFNNGQFKNNPVQNRNQNNYHRQHTYNTNNQHYNYSNIQRQFDNNNNQNNNQRPNYYNQRG